MLPDGQWSQSAFVFGMYPTCPTSYISISEIEKFKYQDATEQELHGQYDRVISHRIVQSQGGSATTEYLFEVLGELFHQVVWGIPSNAEEKEAVVDYWNKRRPVKGHIEQPKNLPRFRISSCDFSYAEKDYENAKQIADSLSNGAISCNGFGSCEGFGLFLHFLTLNTLWKGPFLIIDQRKNLKGWYDILSSYSLRAIVLSGNSANEIIREGALYREDSGEQRKGTLNFEVVITDLQTVEAERLFFGIHLWEVLLSVVECPQYVYGGFKVFPQNQLALFTPQRIYGS